MCSCRTYVPMIACLNIQAFSLRAALRSRPELMRGPVALAPPPGSRPLLGGMLRRRRGGGRAPGDASLGGARQLSRARSRRAGSRCCRGGVGADPAAPRRKPASPSSRSSRDMRTSRPRASSEWRAGINAVLRRALDAVGKYWQPRVGVAGRRFAALAAASVAPAGRAIVVDDAEAELFLEPLPLHLLPLGPERRSGASRAGHQAARVALPSAASGRRRPDGARRRPKP